MGRQGDDHQGMGKGTERIGADNAPKDGMGMDRREAVLPESQGA